jgi:hypothetical protein
MSEEVRVNRPQINPQPQQPMGSMTADIRPQAQKSKMPWIILGVVVLLVVVLGVLFREKLFPGNSDTGSVQGVSTRGSEFQAVFLTNGQVYFGKVSNPTGEYLTLKDIFYLQVTQPPLQGSTPQDQAATQQQQPQISLVKLGNELHGPVDEMHINRDQILFYEDLKEDGQVVKAIRDYKANPAK